jgi:catechol 2,3-dioxygenase-like lactoylglutathione lyase family enzyme
MAFFSRDKKKNETLTRGPSQPTLLKTQEPGIERIGWLGMRVSDVLGEALFLEEKLHLKALVEGNSAAGHHVSYDCQTLRLELVEGGQAWATRAKPRKGSPDISLIPSFAVDQIEQVSQQLNEAEVMITQIYEQGWVASFLFLDVERQLWQVSETRNEPAVGTTELRRIGAVWLAVEDIYKQVPFYRDVLGLPLADLNNRARPITQAAERSQAEEDEIAEHGGGVEPEFQTVDTSPLPRPVFSADADTTDNNLSDAVTFFDTGARLVLTTGGHRVEGRKEKQWGIDTPFMLGFQTNNLSAFVQRLQQAGVKVQGPFRFNADLAPNRLQQAIRFTDPEGNTWQIYE